MTGTLGFFSAIIQFIIGYRFSMAALSDALHAFSDGGADFVGAFIVHKIRLKNPTDGKRIEDIGNKIIAILLFLGAFTIVYEAIERLSGKSHFVVWPRIVVYVTFLGLCLGILRLSMLRKAREHIKVSRSLKSLIGHAETDLWHNGIVFLVVLSTYAVTVFSSQANSYGNAIRSLDCVLSIGLAFWMTFVVAPKMWKGDRCGHEDDRDHEHHH